MRIKKMILWLNSHLNIKNTCVKIIITKQFYIYLGNAQILFVIINKDIKGKKY